MITDKLGFLREKRTIEEKINLISMNPTDYGNSLIIRQVLYDLLQEIEKLKGEKKC